MKFRSPWSRALFTVLLVAFATGAWRNPGAELASPFAHQRIRLVTAAEGNEARYRVREQLASIEFPSDAVGVTNHVTGVLVLEPDGTIVRDESRFTVDLTSLTSDSDRRDNFIRRRTLETEHYPNAEFIPSEFRGLSSPLPSSGELTFEVVGDLTVHGMTRPITWQVTARTASGAYTGTAATSFTFGDFGMTIPRVRSVLSVKDEIRLEYDFKLIVDGG